MYCTSSFFLGRSVAELPTHFLSGCIGGVVVYFMYGLDTADGGGRLFLFLALSGVTIVTSGALFMAVSCKALLLPCVSTVSLSKAVPFRAVLLV
eukprot:SAG22_NODE_1766_length_3623_cov_2.997162_3_plen_94_part_00